MANKAKWSKKLLASIVCQFKKKIISCEISIVFWKLNAHTKQIFVFNKGFPLKSLTLQVRPSKAGQSG